MCEDLDEIDRALLEIIQKIAEDHGISLECYICRLFKKAINHSPDVNIPC